MQLGSLASQQSAAGTRVEREVLIGGTSDVSVEDMAGVQSFWWAYNAEE